MQIYGSNKWMQMPEGEKDTQSTQMNENIAETQQDQTGRPKSF